MGNSISKKKETHEQVAEKHQARMKRSLRLRDRTAVKEVGEALAKHVLYIVDGGLTHGVGEPIRGKMCVEAAVCYAMGEEHDDKPSCVHKSVREAKISLNDAYWSTDKARAKGMRRIAIAQLGSKNIDANLFVSTLGEEFMSLLIGELKAYSKEIKDKSSTDFLIKLSKEASLKKCRNMIRAFPIEGEENSLYGAGYEAILQISSCMVDRSPAEHLVEQMAAWASEAKNKKEVDARLTRIAHCIEKALKKCKSTGVRWLRLCEEK